MNTDNALESSILPNNEDVTWMLLVRVFMDREPIKGSFNRDG